MEEEVIKDDILDILKDYIYIRQDDIAGEQDAAERIAKYIQTLLDNQ